MREAIGFAIVMFICGLVLSPEELGQSFAKVLNAYEQARHTGKDG